MHASLLTTTIGRSQSELRDAQYSNASEVTSVIARVATSTDAGDWATLRAQFMNEVQLHFGNMKAPQQLDADAYVAWVMQAFSCGTAKHSVRFHDVRIDLETGSRANVTSYWQSWYRKQDCDANEVAETRFWCDHELARTADGWKITRIWATTLEDAAFSRWNSRVAASPSGTPRMYR